MIVVDTNVISEAMKLAPSPTVIEWLNKQDAAALFLSTVTIGEIVYGLGILPTGKRRSTLKKSFDKLVEFAFEHRILALDEKAARLYGEIMAERRQMGRPMSMADGQIAAIARCNGFAIATRNVQDFDDCGVAVLNPFAN
jgi:predicted nucleic acid-binding protein